MSVLGLVAVVVALLLTPVASGAGAVVDATWKTHQERSCGIELRYPALYVLEASGARDHCDLWISIGFRDRGRMRALFSVEIRGSESSAQSPRSARDLALHVATAQCSADGPDGSTYCTNAEVRSSFKTTQGFRGFEIHLTEIHETVSPNKIKKSRRGPVFALDLSDDEVVRVLMASGEPARLGELRAILDTLRVWTRARRQVPRVVEISPFRGGQDAFVFAVATSEGYRADGRSSRPV